MSCKQLYIKERDDNLLACAAIPSISTTITLIIMCTLLLPYETTEIVDLQNKAIIEWCTTGIVFFAECPRHSAKAILHSTKLLPSVTLGKKILDKYFIGKEFLPSTFFGHSTKTLPSVEKHSAN
jgi:hypothetical protein